MTENEKLDQLQSEKIRLQVRINEYEGLLQQALLVMRKQNTHIDQLIEIIKRADKLLTGNLELMNKVPRQLRINFLLGVLWGIFILDILQRLIK